MNNSREINWERILIKNPIYSYLINSDKINLSQLTLRLRLHLAPILFQKLIITEDCLLTYPNYFRQENSIQLINLPYWEKLRLLTKFNFNRDLIYKNYQINNFIGQLNGELKGIVNNISYLEFDSLGKSAYFLISITQKFLNLKKLSILSCELPLFQFSLILSKLTKLEVLNLQSISLLKGVEDSEIPNSLNFPKSLKQLTYSLIWLDITNLPQNNTIEFIMNEHLRYSNKDLELTPQYLPNLIKLDYCNFGKSPNLTKFIELNLQLEELELPDICLTTDNKNIIEKMKNLKNYKIH